MSPTLLTNLLADAREFLAAVRFARAEWLLLLLILPLFAALNWYAAARRRRATTAIGRPAAVAGLSTHPRPRCRWVGLAYPLAWVALVLGIAGPRWGKSDEPGVAVGRDLVIVVDLSRSMQAEDMAARGAKKRWEAARAGLRDLLDAVAARGGHRVAVVVFAARPKLACPLTTDYDHVRAVIEELNGDHPPPECRPGPGADAVSGTRIGAGLVAAVAAHDERFPGAQDILLISDGDDPGDDREWLRGADAARKARIPVHVVGLGDPDHPSGIEVVDVAGPTVIATKLEEVPLRQIAADTGGEYLPARREVPRLGDFFRTRIEPNQTRLVSDESLPQPKERFAWFLGPALGLFAIGWVRGR